MSRHAPTWIERRTVVLALIIVLLASGTPNVVSHVSAREAALDRALAAALDPHLAPDSGYQSTGIPPAGDEMQLLSGSITPSGANPQYPANHTFDAAPQTVGTPPTNHDFEVPGYAVGTPPTNYDLQAPVQSVGTPPINHDFETGTLSGWTASGTVSIASDATRGSYARLWYSGSIVSSAFTVDPLTQAFQIDIGTLSSGSNGWSIYVLSGATYSSRSLLTYGPCSGCTGWATQTVDMSAYSGQSIKLEINRTSGEIGVDAPRMLLLFPDFTTTGTVARVEEANGNVYARLDKGAVFTSSAFTVDTAAQFVSIRTIDGGQAGGGQFFMYVLSGTNYATETRVHINSNVPDVWTRIPFNAGSWQGQSIKLKIERQAWAFGIDDIGTQSVDLPGWTVAKDAWIESGGPAGYHVATTGNLTSSAFTIPSNAQQLTVQASGRNNPIFYLELLRGADFSQVVNLAGPLYPSTTDWTTFRAAVQQYAGETVKVRIRQYWGSGLYDNVGVAEVIVPGWTLTTNQAATTGEDANGTWVAPVAVGGAPIELRSQDIATGIVDTASGADMRFYAISYEIGLNNTSGSLIRVYWYNRATGQNWVVFTDASNTPTGFRTKYFYLTDFMGTDGYFVVQVPRSGRLYSIADNIARQQLSEPHSQRVGSGIDTSTGSFGYQETDIGTQGTLPLAFTRYYAGHADHFGAMGYRWQHTYDMRLELTGDGDAGVIYGSGREVFFHGKTNGTFAPVDARVHDTLVRAADGSFSYTTTTNVTYTFNASGVLQTIMDLNGNTITLSYDANGRLATITGLGGQVISLAYDTSGRLSTVTDPENRNWTYGYDAAGDLVSVTDPDTGVRTYTYSRHRLITATNPLGDVLFENVFDDLNRIVAQEDADARGLTIDYDTPGKGSTRVTDRESNVATFHFDRFARTTHLIDPAGNTISRVYDASGNLDKVINPASNTWEFDYAVSGDMTALEDPLGNAFTLTYNTQHLPTAVIDGRGNTTTFTYDSDGNLLTKTDPLNQTWTYTYDSAGNRLTETNPLNQTWTYTYDAAGSVLTKTNPLNQTWTYTYDFFGRVTTVKDPAGATVTYGYSIIGEINRITDQLGHSEEWTYNRWGEITSYTDKTDNQTLYGYDEFGNLTTKIDPANKTWTYTYDANGNQLTATDPLGHVATYVYDSKNQLITATDPLGKTTTYTYDTEGRVLTETDPLGRTTAYGYDASGRRTSMTQPNGGVWTYGYDGNGNLVSQTDPLNQTTTHTYNAVNLRTATTDARGNTTRFSYDAAGRLLSTTDALNRTTTYTYDATGNLMSRTDALGKTWSYDRDAVGRVVEVTDPLQHTTTRTYDLAGRLTGTTDPLQHTTSYGYDDAGRRTSVTRPEGGVTNYTFDPRGLLLTTTDPLTKVTTYGYDAAGRRTSVTDRRNVVTTFTYDAASQMTAMTDALGGIVSFGYDAAGQMTNLTDPNGHTTTYAYGALGNQTSETDPLSRTTTSTYDLLGQLTSTSDPRGIAAGYTYDPNGNLTGMSSGGTPVSYSYDAANQRTSMTDGTGTTTWTYDGAGRVTAVAASSGTVSYAYNDAGWRTSMTLPGSRTFSYAHDAAGRTTSVTDWLNQAITFAYDGDGRRTSITRPNGVTSSYGYDAAGRVTTIDHAGTGLGSTLSFAYTYDAEGNRTSTTTGSGTETYALDPLSRLTKVVYADGQTVEYTYDPNGNRLTETVNGTQTHAYTYDAADQLASDGVDSYAYDGAGNLTSAGSDAYTWDWANRLTSATVDGVTTTYTYDGDDTRTSATTTGGTTAYVWDRLGGVELLIDDGARAYLHDGGALTEIDDSGDTTYDLADGLGSVRATADETGSLGGTADYDVFGAIRTSSGAGSTFGFTGEQQDPSGLTYLRARYHDPGTGRFLSADAVQPNAPGTQGYNTYAYVANNPTTWVDPTGHEAGAGTMPMPGAGAPPIDWKSAANVLRPALNPGWLAIGMRIGFAVAASACAANPIGCAAIAVFVIVVLIIVACVLEIGGPCWFWQSERSESTERSNEGAQARPRERAEPIAPAQPMPTPPNQDPCKTSGDWQALWNALKFKGNHGLGRASTRVSDELGEMWVGPGWRWSTDGKAMVSADGLRVYRPPTYKPREGKVQANFEWKITKGGTTFGNHHLDIDDVNCP